MSEFSEFHEISNRLKKRFNLIRKPNLKEASESYRKLSTQLSSFANYSGYCLYSAAKCEHQIVGSLKEQLNQSANTTATSSSSSSPNNQKSSDRALENLVQEAIWTEFQTWLETGRKFAEMDVIENDLNGAISAYAHAIQTCPSPRLLSVVLSELASVYIKHHRLYEAAEVYIEAGAYREAIDCLLRGHYYQDAYHCYQEMFKHVPNCENFSTLTDLTCVSSATKNSQTTAANQSDSQISKSLILSLFKKKQQQQQQPVGSDEKSDESNSKMSSSSLPPLQSISPFNFSDKILTIDDYINFFLLRLYLYDPVKYEYPSPIIPMPPQCNLENFNENTADDIEDIDKFSKTLSSIEVSAPFFDHVNSFKWLDRSIVDVIELNHLLETLYLSYRNELRPSIDNEYSDFDVITLPSSDENQSSGDDNKRPDSKKDSDSDDEETTECADDSDDGSSSRFATSSTRYDSSDDEHRSKATSNNDNVGEPLSPAFKLLETGELDDISSRIKRLALKCPKTDLVTVQTENDPEISFDQRVKKKFEKIERDWAYQQIEPGQFLGDDYDLRQKIAERLYPLLNGNQIQLLLNIIEEKD